MLDLPDLPIEPYEKEAPPESICDICEESVLTTDDGFIYLINGEKMCRRCAEEWLEAQRIYIDE